MTAYLTDAGRASLRASLEDVLHPRHLPLSDAYLAACVGEAEDAIEDRGAYQIEVRARDTLLGATLTISIPMDDVTIEIDCGITNGEGDKLVSLVLVPARELAGSDPKDEHLVPAIKPNSDPVLILANTAWHGVDSVSMAVAATLLGCFEHEIREAVEAHYPGEVPWDWAPEEDPSDNESDES